MIIIPAIDLHKGRVVRLKQGAFDEVTPYSDDPGEVARSFVQAGAQRIHIVDLDGSVRGKSMNMEAIRAIRAAVEVEIDLGGGIRSLEDAAAIIDLGVDYVILGTMVVKQPEAARQILQEFPGKVGIGIDALDGKVAVHGWKEVTDTLAMEMARRYEAFDPAFVVYTDISRDGMLNGPNLETTAEMIAATRIPVIASGGVSGIEDIENLCGLEGLYGVITGKAVYEGCLDLQAAIAVSQR